MHLFLGFVLALCGLSADVPEETLKAERIAVGVRDVVMGDDGSIWAIDRPREAGQQDKDDHFDEYYRLIRIDQGQWQVMESKQRYSMFCLVPGAKGVMLFEGYDAQWRLYRGNKKLATGGITGIIEDHRELIAQAFGPEHSPSPITEDVMIVASPEGTIWCLNHGALIVLIGNRWHDALDPLTKAGFRSGNIKYLAPLGDGRRVYVSDLTSVYHGGCSFFGQLEDGKLQFSKAPHHVCNRDLPLTLRDREGGTWIPTVESMGAWVDGQYSSDITLHFDKEGNFIEQLENVGHACFADESNNIWQYFNNAVPYYNVWRNGEIVRKLEVPTEREGNCLFSDRPGSVYALADGKLHHLSADPPDFQKYRIERLYTFPGIQGKPYRIFYSRQGWCVIKSDSTLSLVRIPK